MTEKNKEEKRLKKQLKQYHKNGISIVIAGKEAKKEKDFKPLFLAREDGATYMADYIGNDEGKIKKISFDLVYPQAGKNGENRQ